MSRNKKVGAKQAIAGVKSLLDFIGIGNEEGTAETPARVVKALLEFSQPINEKNLFKAFDNDGKDHGFSGMVVQSNIPFRMLCEHHLMPATGIASLGYIPDGKVIGLSKLSRIIDAVATSRPSLQEIICSKVVDLMDKNLKPRGTMCVITAEHGCMACRGVNKPNVPTTTSSLSGAFIHVPHARAEFFELSKRRARSE